MRLVLLPILILSCGLLLSAQTNEVSRCPQIAVYGPPGIVAPGEIATFTAQIGKFDRVTNLRYQWSWSAGEIVSGQGTNTLFVRQPVDAITVTVEIKGLPEGCPNLFSETEILDRPPQAIKLDAFSGTISNTSTDRFEKIKRAMLINVNSQLLIYMVYRKGASARDIENWRKIIFTAVRIPEEDYRITAIDAGDAANNFVEIWLVPPGANLPQCEQCRSYVETTGLTCPRITITGPAQIIEPGGTATFRAAVSGAPRVGVRYHWDISKGTIVGEQQTESIRVRVPKKSDGYVLTAMLNVAGLPRTCPTLVSENALVAARLIGDPLDEYGSLSLNDEKARLENAARALRRNPRYKLFILTYFERPSERNSKRIREIVTFLTNSAKVLRDRFRIKSSIGRRNETILWLVAPGSDEPVP